MKVFKRRKGQPEQKMEALRFALNERLNDLRMMEEIDARRKTETAEDLQGISSAELLTQIRKSYVGRFRTKRLRKKHANLVMPTSKGAHTL